MNFLDRAIGWFAPGFGLSRVRTRAALGLIARAYDGARLGRRTENWIASGASANVEVGVAMSRLRNRSRDLVRNNPYAAKAVQSIVSNLVGTGINPRPDTGQHNLDSTIGTLWRKFAWSCDADGLTDFSGLQALIARAMIESGECLVRIRDRRLSDGLAVPFQLQVLEPDLLDGGKYGELADGGFIIQGIEFDALGRRRAYWLFPQHPGEMWPGFRLPYESRRVPAASVMHIFDRLRPGQVRGVPWLASTMLKLRDLDDYDEAEIFRKKLEACLAAFVTGDNTTTEPNTLGKSSTADDGERGETFRPGMIKYLAPGQDVKFATPAAVGGYPEYMRVQLHAIAAGAGVTYEQLTGDLSQVNYSSIRAGLLEFRRRIETLQWQVMVPQLCQPVWDRFAGVAQVMGALPDGEMAVEWTPPRFEAVDPQKDVKADVMAIRAGLMTLKEGIARQGYSPDQVLAEIAETNALLDKLGIVLDVDPRRATQTGNPVAAGAQEEQSNADEVEDDEDKDEEDAAAA